MKKLNKLFAILIAVLGVDSLSAQTWTAPVIGQDLKDVNNNTELYMYNVKADAFACSGMSWGTHATVKELQNGDTKFSGDVHRCRVSKPTDGQLQIMLNERTYLGGGGPSSTNDCWVDHGSNNVYIYNEVSDNVYTLKPTTATNESYLDCAWAYGGHITFSATNGYGNTEWAFVLRKDITDGKYLLYKAKKEMYDIYTALKAAGHETTYAPALSTANKAYTASDATAASVNAATKTLLATVAPALQSKYFAANSLFNNPDMRGFGDDTDWGNGLNAFADGIFESWHSAETITQKQTGLPNGFYTVVFLGMYRQDGGDAAPTLTLTSGNKSAKANLKSIAEIDFGGCSGNNGWTNANKPNNTYSAGEALAHTDAGVKVENFFVENGELTVTVAMPSSSQWLLCQGFQIYYKAESLEQYSSLFNTAKATAQAIVPTTLNEYVAGVLSTALDNAENEQVNKEWYQASTKKLNDAIALAESVATPYANVKSLLATCESILNNSTEFEDGAKNIFSTAVNTAITEVEKAQTVGAINDVYNTLESARQVYVQKADPTNETYFDYTFKVSNPAFDNAKTEGWTSESAAQNQNIATNKTNGVIDGPFFENWNGEAFIGSIYQNISGLPSGKYLLKVAAFGDGAYIFANNESTKVTTTDGAWYEVNVAVSEGSLKIGIKNENATNWMGIDNASLKYYGFDPTTAQNGVKSLKSQAETLAQKPMNADVAVALSNAIKGADATKTGRNELNAMVETLSEAVKNAESSVADYEKIAGYISITKVFTDGTEYEANVSVYENKYKNRQFASDEVEVVRQDMNVMRFNAASDIFTNKVDVTGWTGTMGEMSNEHWSGDAVPYKDANSWNDVDPDALTTQIELTKGNYVLKVAGRSSAEHATLKLNVLDQSITFHGKDSKGRGIDVDGNANFSDEGTYARDGEGYGWEWEFLKFSLDEDQIVTLEVNSSYDNTRYVWNSFGDITLWMDDETYVNVHGHAIKEPLAAAEELVNTLPLGVDVNQALEDAIVLSKTFEKTPEGLDDAIAALEAAVANANTWRDTYYEKKPDLVKALERFEADFNDAENGALAYMNKDVWATVIGKVQNAASAKDDRTSHEGLTKATNELNAALDAAQASIDAYAALKTEINSAKNYTPIVAENTSEHSNDLNEAESGYNNATIETGRANELTAALQNYRVLDYNHVVEAYNVVELTGEWTGKTNVNHGEHWSGDAEATYFDYSRWSEAGVYEATKTVSLPAGEYVLMAAGRAADVEGTEAYIKVNDVKAIFPTKSSYGRGITKYGTATFNADSTYARDNVGYGWEYRFIAFTLVEEAEVTIVAGMNISDSWEPLAWAGVCTPVLYTTPLTAAKENLENAISAAQSVLNGYPVGDGAFQVDANCDAYQGLSSAISTAQGVLNSSIVVDELVAAIEPLNTAVENYKNGYVLNAPEEGVAYNIVMSAGWEYDGKAVTYIANDRKDHGLYNIKYHAAPNANYAQAFTFTPVEGKTNCFTLSMKDVDGNQRYVSTGVPYEGNANQIRTTTDATQALAVKVIATATDGIHQLWNTEANQYIGGQDAGFFTVNSHTTFRLQKAAKANVTLTLSKVGWATLILPFDAELPEGVKAYSCSEANDETLTLIEAESIKANTPYLMNGQESTHEFSSYGLADKDSYTVGLFTGTYVEYQTEAGKGTYVLQNIDGDVAFYLVNSKLPKVGAYRCYMTYETSAGAPKFSFGRGEGTTSIDNMESTANSQQPIVIYDLMGRKVNTMEKGGMYIVNGKKVIVK